MPDELRETRRNIIKAAIFAFPAAQSLVTGSLGLAAENKSEDVSPAEDLMREHGALNRILLIYDEAVRRLKAKLELEPQIVSQSAELIRAFIENYHEKLEEQHLFTRFEKANKLTDLVATLRQQHQAGRELTTTIIADASAMQSRSARLIASLEAFNRMYRPHEAREDTILFPAFRKLVSDKEYAELGEQFEDREHELFGKEGFESNVQKIAHLEKQLGIYELGQFTPAKE